MTRSKLIYGQKVNLPNTIPGFNRQATAIMSIRILTPRGWETIGYEFICGCGHSPRYLNRYFDDPYAAAKANLQMHHCPPEKKNVGKKWREITNARRLSQNQ